MVLDITEQQTPPALRESVDLILLLGELCPLKQIHS